MLYDSYRYITVKHERDPGNDVNPDRHELLRIAGDVYKTEGLNTLDYKVRKMKYITLLGRVCF